MDCMKCDRCPDCNYKLNVTTAGNLLKGKCVYISGLGCPKDWHDKEAEDMTKEQLIEAVKELRREKLTDILSATKGKSAEENMKSTRLWKEPSKAYKKFMDELNAYELIYDKPPLGCKPSWLSSGNRIKELSEAITRNIGDIHKDVKEIKKWATEILYHCEIMEKC